MKQREQILILTASSPKHQSGIIALDILEALTSSDLYTVHLLTKEWVKKDDRILSVESKYRTIWKKFRNRLFRILKKQTGSTIAVDKNYSSHEFNETITYYPTEKILSRAKMIPDRIIVLFMQGFLSFKNLYELQNLTSAKIYLFPMDMAPFTGGCHWAWGCEGYKFECKNCPAILSGGKVDQSYINQEFKLHYVRKMDLELFAANSQLSEQIKSSKIFSNKIIHPHIFALPNKKIFFPSPKIEACERLGIDAERTIFFFGANSLTSKSKGVNVLLNALQKIKRDLISSGNESDFYFLIAGQKFAEMEINFPFEYKYLGYFADVKELSIAYNAADFYISPSIQDAGPLMVLQAMACGTPVISFDVGFARDFIINGYNGYKAHDISHEALANQISAAASLDRLNREKMRMNNLRLYQEKASIKLITKLQEAFAG